MNNIDSKTCSEGEICGVITLKGYNRDGKRVETVDRGCCPGRGCPGVLGVQPPFTDPAEGCYTIEAQVSF